MKKIFRLQEYYVAEKCAFLTVKFSDETDNAYNLFVDKFRDSYYGVLEDIDSRIVNMAELTGAQEEFFKSEGSNSVVRFIKTGSLRIYCLRYGNTCIILGGGGTKEVHQRTYQDSEVLKRAVKILQVIDKDLVGEECDFTNLRKYLDIDFEVDI